MFYDHGSKGTMTITEKQKWTCSTLDPDQQLFTISYNLVFLYKKILNFAIFQKKVQFSISGDFFETGIRVLSQENRKNLLTTSSVDSFIMTVKKYDFFLFLNKKTH